MAISELWQHTDHFICCSTKPAEQTGMHTTPIKGSIKTPSCEFCVAQTSKTYNRGMRRNELLCQTRSLGLPVRCIRGQTAQPAEPSVSCPDRSRDVLPAGEPLGSTTSLEPSPHFHTLLLFVSPGSPWGLVL